MSNAVSLLGLETLELALNVDTSRLVADSFKLPAALLGVATGRRTGLATALAAASLAEGDRAGASTTCRNSLTRLERWHRAGLRYLDGLIPDAVPIVGLVSGPHISDATRLQLMESYGFSGGVAGDFDDARREELGRLAPLAASISVPNVSWHYSPSLLAVIAGDYATLQAFQALATGGARQLATLAVTTQTDLVTDAVARVRGYYISASDLGDRTPELARIGLQPRRLPGEAGSGLLPDAPLTPVHDAAAHTLTIPALPGNSSSIRAYRQAPGGPRELAGISLTPVVSAVMAGPLAAGVTYDAWVVGVLENREGPESPRISITG